MTKRGVLQDLGRCIQKMRLDAGFSQEKLAELSGLHRTYLSHVERGSRNPTILSLLRIAAALDCGLSEIVSSINPSRAKPIRHIARTALRSSAKRH